MTLGHQTEIKPNGDTGTASNEKCGLEHQHVKLMSNSKLRAKTLATFASNMAH